MQEATLRDVRHAYRVSAQCISTPGDRKPNKHPKAVRKLIEQRIAANRRLANQKNPQPLIEEPIDFESLSPATSSRGCPPTLQADGAGLSFPQE